MKNRNENYNIDLTKLTPMMKQYLSIKEQHEDTILFYRLGDFYEMFFDDATKAARELEITLTGKSCGLDERAPMCGVPYHSAENYINRLIKKGYKVAIAEQVEDPSSAKGIVKREVVKILTPGSNINMEALDANSNNYLMSVYMNENKYGISYIDVTTGEFFATQIKSYNELIDETSKIVPVEIIVNEKLRDSEYLDYLKNTYKTFVNIYEEDFFEEEKSKEVLLKHFDLKNLDALGIDGYIECIKTCGALISYLQITQKSNLSHINNIRYYLSNSFMIIDSSTRRNLELVETMREKERKGSLLWVLDNTKTAMGARKLKHFIIEPLTDVKKINYRLDGVEEMFSDLMLREELRELLTPIYDMERLMTKISLGTANPRDLLGFKQSISVLPDIKKICNTTNSEIIKDIAYELDELGDVFDLIENSIKEEPPIVIKDGKIFKDGFNEQVDKLRAANSDGKNWLFELEQEERKKTSIKNLKIKYSKVIGYFIEVTKSNTSLVPDYYERKQTLTNAERYITPKLKELEGTILGAEERLVNLEYELYIELRTKLAENVLRIKSASSLIALIDTLQSLANVAVNNNYVRPKFNDKGIIDIKEGRHPVIEKIIGKEKFIDNDTVMDLEKQKFTIITGPNMAGKSTYMRQVALITLLSQIGAFVPATSVNICPVDRIFTRVGASDDLASGKSTFMVEMSEVANILRNSTDKSLVILDEIGRGTSTFDGLSIAWSVVEYLVKNVGAKSLFATHYHELTELEEHIKGVANYKISVKEKGEDIIFLRKIAKGGANSSYGIQVARLAGVPLPVINRAKDILMELSSADITKKAKELTNKKQYAQVDMFAKKEEPVVTKLKEIDINKLTPMEAMNVLNELKKLIPND